MSTSAVEVSGPGRPVSLVPVCSQSFCDAAMKLRYFIVLSALFEPLLPTRGSTDPPRHRQQLVAQGTTEPGEIARLASDVVFGKATSAGAGVEEHQVAGCSCQHNRPRGTLRTPVGSAGKSIGNSIRRWSAC